MFATPHDFWVNASGFGHLVKLRRHIQRERHQDLQGEGDKLVGHGSELLPGLYQWKSMTVSVTASPDNPESCDATKRTVTLTATPDIPSGVTCQWQLGSGGLGQPRCPTASVSKTVSLTTRGARKFRVQTSHAIVPSVEPVYVTWDEW